MSQWKAQFQQIDDSIIHESAKANSLSSSYESGDLSVCGCPAKVKKGVMCCFDKEICINAATMTECSRERCDPSVCQNQCFTRRKYAKLGEYSRIWPRINHNVFDRVNLLETQRLN